MAAKSKNMNDVYCWIKTKVIPSLTSLDQIKSTRKLINNFYDQYEGKRGWLELNSELEHLLIDVEFDFLGNKLNKNNE